MQVIIIEDEQLAQENLEQLLLKIDNNIEVIARLESIRASVKWLMSNKCDLIFLDIHLSDGNSFNIFDQIEVKTPIIFTTAYDQYAIKAFKFNSIDYLLKPINQYDLALSIQKFKELYDHQNLPDYKSILNLLKQPDKYQERFLVNAGQKLKSIKTLDIAYFYVQNEAVFICTEDNKHYDINYTLDKLEMLLDPKTFFRINRQFIVNIESVIQMHIVSKSRLKLDLKPNYSEDVIVSFNNVHNFKHWLNK